MTTAETLAFWALIVGGATFLVYLGQLIVLILVYRRVIKETDRNAEERRREIDKAGDMMIAQSKDIERRLNGIAKRNSIGFGLMGILAGVMLFANSAVVRKFERNNTKKQGK